MIDLICGWKEKIGQALRIIGAIDKVFTGKIVINISQGVVCDIEKQEKIK